MATIMVIDDDENARSAMTRVLRTAGHNVVEAENGLRGLERLRQAPVDLVITDLLMPEMEGIETIRELRRGHPGVRIIAMSGGGMGKAADYLPFAGALGAQRALEKPFTAEQLLAAVQDVLAI